jgi:hypothetical protein
MIINYTKSILNFSLISSTKTQKFHSLIPFVLILFLLNTSYKALSQQKTLGLTKNLTGSTADGYILFAPMGSKTTYLIDKCGKKINSWVSNYSPGLSAYLLPTGHLLRTGISNDTFFIGSGKGGIIEKLDWDGKVVWSYKISNDSLAQHHDIYPMENGNILVIAWHGISAAEAESRGRIKGTIGGPKLWSERIIEIKPKNNNDAEVVWQWSLRDHLIQDASISKPDFNMISSHPELMNINYVPMAGPDWIHMNSLDYNKDLDQILISCHNNSEIWIIDHSTTTSEAASHHGGNSGMGGDLLYRWGNPLAYNKGSKSSQKFFKQHNALWIPKGYKDEGGIMVFNNGLGRSPSYSSVEIIAPPVNSFGEYNPLLPYGPSAQKWIYKDSIPTTFYSAVISGASRLFNGNTLVCSGNSGKFFEVNANNKVVWEYISPVSSGDYLLHDGSSPNGNAVFRCNYYKSDFPGFKDKNLLPGSPIEKNPYSYTCNQSDIDLIGPQPLVTYPSLNSKGVAVNSMLSIQFNENIFAGNSGEIRIFENGVLKQQIRSDDPLLVIENKSVSFFPTNLLQTNSRIAISFDASCFLDGSGNKCNALDTADWSFNTISSISINESVKNLKIKIYPNPSSGKIRISTQSSLLGLKVFDQFGREMVCKVELISPNEFSLNLEHLINGPYIIVSASGITHRINKLTTQN